VLPTSQQDFIYGKAARRVSLLLAALTASQSDSKVRPQALGETLLRPRTVVLSLPFSGFEGAAWPRAVSHFVGSV